MPGSSGSRWMPRKMSGIAISTIERVDRREQHAERRVRERDPLVAVADCVAVYQATCSVYLSDNPRMPAPRRRSCRVASELRLVLGQLIRRLRAEHSLPDFAGDRAQPARPRGPADDERARCGRARAAAVDGADACRARDGRADRAAPRPWRSSTLHIELTPQGRERVLEGRGRREDWLAAAIAAELSPEEQRTLLAAVPLLQRLSRH